MYGCETVGGILRCGIRSAKVNLSKNDAGSTSSTVFLPPNPSQLWPLVANVFRVASRKHLRAKPSEHNTKFDAKLKVHQWIPSALNTSPTALLVVDLPFSASKTIKMNQNIGLPIAYHVSSRLHTSAFPQALTKPSSSPYALAAPLPRHLIQFFFSIEKAAGPRSSPIVPRNEAGDLHLTRPPFDSHPCFKDSKATSQTQQFLRNYFHIKMLNRGDVMLRASVCGRRETNEKPAWPVGSSGEGLTQGSSSGAFGVAISPLAKMG
ncbi:hypothetical protein PIB30_071591 [Stylosanthes scabra]|uniref:Uncharacterized protein n=1 Tax=Stylosanthes scabra TaxID=79078 RepID=A0ABU6YMT7_9FABA|nr:hypothetical protein [Stylosanthes scabra]